MFKILKVLGVSLLLSFGWCFQVEAQEVFPEIGGYLQVSLPCPKNPEIIVERCMWVLWDSGCDPSVQDLC